MGVSKTVILAALMVVLMAIGATAATISGTFSGGRVNDTSGGPGPGSSLWGTMQWGEDVWSAD